MSQPPSKQGEPIWCPRCECYVPKEREPHLNPYTREMHYAKWAERPEGEERA